MQASAHTLTEAIQKALLTNPEILSARAALNVSQEQLNSAQAAYLPTVDLSLTAGEENTDKPSSSAITDMWMQDHSLTLTQNLFDGGATDSSVDRSQEMLKQAEIRIEDLTGTMTLNVIESWYELYRLQRVSQLLQRNVAQHSQLFAQIQQKVQVGAAAKAELTAVEGPYIAALTAQAANRGQLSDAIARYTKVVGERPQGALPNPVPLLANVVLPETADDAVARVIASAPSIRTAESNLLAATADHRGSKAGMLPTLDFEFTELLKNDAAGTEGTEYGWSALLKVNYNLYSGGADEARRRETAQALEDSREQLALAQRTAEEQMRIGWSALQVSGQMLQLNQRQLQSATETLSSSREQFKLGEVEMMAVMGAEDGLLQAQQSVLQEQVTGTLARYRLLNQLGLLKLDGDTVVESEPKASSEEGADEEGMIDRMLDEGSKLGQQLEQMLNPQQGVATEEINIDAEPEPPQVAQEEMIETSLVVEKRIDADAEEMIQFPAEDDVVEQMLQSGEEAMDQKASSEDRVVEEGMMGRMLDQGSKLGRQLEQMLNPQQSVATEEINIDAESEPPQVAQEEMIETSLVVEKRIDADAEEMIQFPAEDDVVEQMLQSGEEAMDQKASSEDGAAEEGVIGRMLDQGSKLGQQLEQMLNRQQDVASEEINVDAEPEPPQVAREEMTEVSLVIEKRIDADTEEAIQFPAEDDVVEQMLRSGGEAMEQLEGLLKLDGLLPELSLEWRDLLPQEENS